MKSKASKIGIIGGSGVEDLLFTEGFKSKVVKTEYGQVNVLQGNVNNKSIIFLNRHGRNYASPSQINYRANMAALRDEGAEDIIATAAVGSINPRMRPGEFVVLTDFIDFTRGRIQTFTPNSFVDVSRPYSSFLVKKITNAAVKLRIKTHPGVTYVCTEGPRFETKAEIKMFGKLGADVVGMTQVPEVVLAAEAGIPYAVVGVITNFAVGISPKKVSAEEVVAVMKQRKESLSKLLALVIKSL
jgi:5'-methylthioadenosine phosphorylase